MTAMRSFPLVGGRNIPELRGLGGWTIREAAGTPAPATVILRHGKVQGPILAVVELPANGFDDVTVGGRDWLSAPDGVFPEVVAGTVEGALYAARTEVPDTFEAALLDTNPVGYWRLGEASGTTAYDSSGNGHNGTYTNGPTLGQPGLIVDPDTAVSFDGVDDRVTVPQDPALQITGALTVQAWITPTQTAADKRVVYQGDVDGSTVRHYELVVSNNGSIWFVWRDAGGVKVIGSTPGSIVAGNTYHAVVTRDASLFVRIYVNGVQVESAQGTAPTGTPTHFRISGLGDSQQWFNGTIDEVAVHNVALTPAQVAELYAAGA